MLYLEMGEWMDGWMGVCVCGCYRYMIECIYIYIFDIHGWLI